MSNEIIMFCGNVVCRDGIDKMKRVTRKDTLLEVAKMARDDALGVSSDSYLAMMHFAAKIERMAEEAQS